ncbi:MAG: tRNA epoxyqueuosine(34) reductase QueG [Planctomycetota bacterium]|nr:tRNA epoxyqueuosine(34) reductase QueG [Planctomycetota bacterium]
MRISPELVREMADEAGFTVVRFGPPDPGTHAARFDDWLDQGRHGEMRWLDAQRAEIKDPLRWAPHARSAIALAFDYGRPAAEIQGGARIARYAVGRDYHRALGNRTKKLRERLEGEGVPRGTVRVGTDAVPILERALAVRAGVGFLAKSAGVISPTHGPYLLLSELLTPLELPFDLPAPGSCGTCTRCIDACPTGAIVAPFQVDARRCLSYTTIELRGRIPEDMREPQGEWLFGCDVCLEVCPFASSRGRATRPEQELPAELVPHRAVTDYDLVGILELDEESYDADWTGTAMRRATRTGLRRNAAVVLGNLGDGSALPALRRTLTDPDPIVREHAAWAIGRIDPRDPGLEPALRGESDANVRSALRSAMDRR